MGRSSPRNVRGVRDADRREHVLTIGRRRSCEALGCKMNKRTRIERVTFAFREDEITQPCEPVHDRFDLDEDLDFDADLDSDCGFVVAPSSPRLSTLNVVVDTPTGPRSAYFRGFDWDDRGLLIHVSYENDHQVVVLHVDRVSGLARFSKINHTDE